MIKDQDVFNDEDYSERNLKNIYNMKSINKIKM